MTPDTLGKYEIRRTLGRGAMGVVYEGWDPIISRRVAIKTVRLPDAGDAEAQEELARFKREAQAAGRLNHPNVVGVFDYAETNELAYIVMEFVEGQTLKGVMGEQERMTLPAISRILKEVLEGLAYCHERGVVHRDIKPANIMITPEGQSKIADFGIARIESSSMTQAGTVLGTPAYMSPEQFMGVVVDARTDIYSTGVLLFQLLTGERPFEGSMTTIMHKVLNTTPPRPSDLAITVPRSLDEVVSRAMSRRPEDRFPSALAFSEALQAALVAPPPPPPPPLVPQSPEDGTIILTKKQSPASLLQTLGQPAPATTKPLATPEPVPGPVPGPLPGRNRVPLLAGVAAGVLIAGGAAAYFATRPDTPVNPQRPGSSEFATAANDTPRPTQPPAAATAPALAAPTVAQTAAPARPALPPIQDVRPVSTPVVTSNRTPPPPPTGTVAPPPVTGGASAAMPPVASQPQASPSFGAAAAVPPTQIPSAPPAVTLPSVQAQSPTYQAPAYQTPTYQTPGYQPPAAATPQPTVIGPSIPARAPDVVPTTAPPPQVAMLSPAALRPALAQALAETSCSFTAGNLSPQGVADVHGVASAPAIAAMQQAASAATPGLTIDWNLTNVDPAQFCPVLDMIHPLAPEFGNALSVRLSLASGRTRLVTDEFIMPHVTMPNFPAYLTVDYFVHDGTMVQLFPYKNDPAANETRKLFAAQGQVTMGKPQGKFDGWQVAEPYGRDMIVAIASSVPLMGIRPVDPANPVEQTSAYLAALNAAIDAARKHEGRVTADALVLDTAPK
jgi:serine/threonine-protein kinase